MSYSRWNTSKWYTYWTTTSSESTEFKLPTRRLKRNQVFEVADYESYQISYGDIQDKSMATIISKAKELYPEATWEELMELQSYILQFKQDVDNRFKRKTFFLFEWWYPIRNKVYCIVRDLKNIICQK